MTKEERAAKWEAEFIPCKNHPDRRCNKSRYARAASNECGSCKNGHTPATKARFTRYNRSDKGAVRKAWQQERKLHG